MKIYISFLLLFIFVSCGTKHKEYAENVLPYSEFPLEKELKGEVIELDTALFRCPSMRSGEMMDQAASNCGLFFSSFP